jgi:hypothetical protein
LGLFTFTLSAASPDGQIATKSLVLRVRTLDPHTISTSQLPSGQVSTAYGVFLVASGGAPGYSWTVSGGNLPPGLTMDSSGHLSGSPATAGTFNFTVKVIDALAQTATGNLVLTITPCLIGCEMFFPTVLLGRTSPGIH